MASGRAGGADAGQTLVVALVGLSLYGDPPYAEALRTSVRTRVATLTRLYVAAGCPPAEAEPLATTLVARLRGLLMDLLVTGDDERVDAAFALLHDEARVRVAGWGATGG